MTTLGLALLLGAAHAAPAATDPGAVDASDDLADDLDGISPDLGEAAAPRVVGGHRAQVGAWPDVALVWLGDGLCTGTLIHPQWVLTAGHCVYGDGSSPQEIVLGATSLADLYGGPLPEGIDDRTVAKSVAHPIYRQSQYGHDIALVKLAKPITDVAPAVLGRDCVVERDLVDGADVFVVGWGSTTVSGNDTNYTLNAGKTKVQTADCSARTVDGIWTGCAGDADVPTEVGAGGNGTDACFGDSGGPLYLPTDAGTFLVGVTSRAYAGVPDREPCGHGGIYTRPDGVVGWIEKTIGEALPRPVCTAAPSASADPVVAPGGHATPVALHVTDPDGATYTVTVKTPPAHGTVEVDGEDVRYRPDAGFVGDDPFVLTITDDGDPAYPHNPPASVDVAVAATAVGGCGCATGGGAPALGWLGLLVVAAGRRRR